MHFRGHKKGGSGPGYQPAGHHVPPHPHTRARAQRVHVASALPATPIPPTRKITVAQRTARDLMQLCNCFCYCFFFFFFFSVDLANATVYSHPFATHTHTREARPAGICGIRYRFCFWCCCCCIIQFDAARPDTHTGPVWTPFSRFQPRFCTGIRARQGFCTLPLPTRLLLDQLGLSTACVRATTTEQSASNKTNTEQEAGAATAANFSGRTSPTELQSSLTWHTTGLWKILF